MIMMGEGGDKLSVLLIKFQSQVWQKCQNENIFACGDEHLLCIVISMSNSPERNIGIFTNVI